ncbi:MAG: hypothetical protein ACI4E1_04010 [Lachnospira sp.]
MGFVNRKLEEDEIREYVLAYPRKGVKAAFRGGTIDTENDVRLFCYANGPKGKMEPCDIYSFVFDYKGKVYYINLRKKTSEHVVHWYSACDLVHFNSEQLHSLREAIKVYAYLGYSIHNSFMEINDSVNVNIEF